MTFTCDGISIDVLFIVKPSSMPDRMVLKWNGRDPEEPWRVSGGETITGLTFDVLDDKVGGWVD